jgi:hypothetical protein
MHFQLIYYCSNPPVNSSNIFSVFHQVDEPDLEFKEHFLCNHTSYEHKSNGFYGILKELHISILEAQ